MHEEAEAQVVAGQRGDVVDQALGGAQAPQHVAHELGAGFVVADEGHAAVGAGGARGRLGGVVEEGREAHALAVSELVGQRRAEQRGHRRGVLAER